MLCVSCMPVSQRFGDSLDCEVSEGQLHASVHGLGREAVKPSDGDGSGAGSVALGCRADEPDPSSVEPLGAFDEYALGLLKLSGALELPGGVETGTIIA